MNYGQNQENLKRESSEHESCLRTLDKKKLIGAFLTRNYQTNKESVPKFVIPFCRVGHGEHVGRKKNEKHIFYLE